MLNALLSEFGTNHMGSFEMQMQILALTRRGLSPANITGVASLVFKFQSFDDEYVLAFFHFILRRKVFQIDRVAVFRPLCPIRFAHIVKHFY